MKYLVFIIILLIISISSYAQESQKNYMLLLVAFEDRTGIENPLLAAFNDTIDFVLSRQTGPVQVRLIPKSDRDALLARAAMMHSDKTLLERGLLAAEWADADGLITGSYTKQGTQWLLQAQVYHLKEGRKARQEIQIQGDSVYKLLDDFPAHLLKQFKASYITLTTNSWKAYEEFRKGHQALQNYNFFGALEYYDKALELDPTLALAYAEQSYIYSITGQGEQATKAINRAQQYISQASPIERLAIQALAFCWDAEAGNYRYEGAVDFLASGGGYDEEWLRWVMANVYQESDSLEEVGREYERWFTVAEEKLRWKKDDLNYLFALSAKCAGADIHIDNAIEYAERLLQLNPPPSPLVNHLIYLYGQQAQVEKAFQILLTDVSTSKENEESEENIGVGIPAALGIRWDGRWDAFAQIILENRVPLERVHQWCQLLMDSEDPEAKVESHYLLAWAYAREGDLEAAKSLYTQIGASWEQDWSVVGPFDGNVYGMDSVLPPEGDIHLTQVYEGAVGPVRWKNANDGYLNGHVEFTETLDFPEEQCAHSWFQPKVLPGRGFVPHRSNYRNYYNRIAYALIYIESDNTQNAILRLDIYTGDYKWKVLLNDTVVFPLNELAVADPDTSYTIPTKLHVGLNKILIKALQRENTGLHFAFRVTDSDGNPVPGLQFRSASEVLEKQ